MKYRHAKGHFNSVRRQPAAATTTQRYLHLAVLYVDKFLHMRVWVCVCCVVNNWLRICVLMSPAAEFRFSMLRCAHKCETEKKNHLIEINYSDLSFMEKNAAAKMRTHLWHLTRKYSFYKILNSQNFVINRCEDGEEKSNEKRKKQNLNWNAYASVRLEVFKFHRRIQSAIGPL